MSNHCSPLSPTADPADRQDGTGVSVKTFDSPADFVLISGEPTNEPVVQHGPFVMNTNQVMID